MRPLIPPPPLKVRLVDNGYFIPKGIISEFDLVYDANRNIVLESILSRGKNSDFDDVSRAPAVLPSEIDSKMTIKDEKLLFLGPFNNKSYGHWITEGLARYWYLLDHEQQRLKIPLASTSIFRKLGQYVKDFFLHRTQHWKVGPEAFGILPNDFLPCPEPIRAKKIIVPECSMHNRSEIRIEHVMVTRRISNHVVNAVLTKQDSTPIYLSRTKLKKSTRSLVGEDKVEEYFSGLGVKIVYPEQLSLTEQIVLFNTHNTFIGVMGSAFHSILFRTIDEKATCIYLGSDMNNINYELIDKLMDNKSVYIQCMKKVSDTKRLLIINIENVIAGISALGM